MACLRDGFEEGHILNDRFVTLAPLNHGSFGMVFTATDKLTGAEVAIKCITKADAVKDHTPCPAAIATDERSEELEIHSRLSLHPHIVNLIHHFETAAHQYMVLELCNNGDLYEAIRTGRGPLETEHVRDFMLELVNAIEHLHVNGVYHRDIKPENIFLTADGAMKLGDFGLATTETWSTEFAVGSDRYMAPEQYESSVYGFGYSPASADVWAIGIVLLNVLFQRNPFASPTPKDPLFSDFARSRESLLDVFPTMSQDTYNVLTHSLALDPANRSLGAVREALKAVRSFTTDDEALDEFCTEQTDLAPVSTAAREPLRTPSITSPNMTADSFPWADALRKTPQKAVRQLSTIRDDEPDLFPGSFKSEEWQYVDADTDADADGASLHSNVDSGLGMSYKSARSSKSIAWSLPAPSNVLGSLPITFTKPAGKTSPYGALGSGFSKSWSDLYEEDFEMEEQGRGSFDFGLELESVGTAQPSTPQPQTPSEDDGGSATPRPILAEADVNVRGSVSPMRRVLDNDNASAELPKIRSSSSFLVDKWAMLGNLRRGVKQESSSTTPTPIPQKSKYSDAFANFSASFGSSSTKKLKPASKPREEAPSWRQDSPERLRSTTMNKSQVWERKDSPPQPAQSWELDNNWRDHRRPANTISSPSPSPTKNPSERPAYLRRRSGENFLETILRPASNAGSDDGDLRFDINGDLEWVGKVQPFHT